MEIKLYANGCGTGKTTSMKKLIHDHSDEPFLVIVPSKELANEYISYGEVIISDQAESVQSRIFSALQNVVRVIIITHVAFLDCQFKNDLVRRRIVIQDEAMDVFRQKSADLEDHTNEYKNIFSLGPVHQKMNIYPATINFETIEDILTNRDAYTTTDVFEYLKSNKPLCWLSNNRFDKSAVLSMIVPASIYKGAKDIYIACADFTNTLQYMLWSTVCKVKFKIEREFIRYNTPNLTIHYPDQKLNSIEYNKHHPELRMAFVDYVKKTTNVNVVYIDNNTNDNISGWTRASHNCHGVNAHRNSTHLAMLSAINYNNYTTTFLSAVTGIKPNRINLTRNGELAHQFFMRGTLRMNLLNECHIYVMDKTLMEYLNTTTFVTNKFVLVNDISRTRKERKPRLTPAQKQKAYRERQKAKKNMI